MNIEYEIIRSRRKTCVIQIYPDNRVVVRAPNRMPLYEIQNFVRKKENWILSNIEKYRAKSESFKELEPIDELEIANLKEIAKQELPKRVDYFANIIGVQYNHITIRLQKTRWGSCSSKRNLNFNCLIMLMPNEVVDYVVVHELCHIKQMNHSKAFWREVENVLPNYKHSYNWLKENGNIIMARVKFD